MDGIIPIGNMKLTPEIIGSEIKRVRKSQQVTQRELALTAGTGLRFIIELESGKPTCQLGKTLSVLNTLGIDLNFSTLHSVNEKRG